MPDFFKDFLHAEILAHRRGSPPVVHFAAFGKHPAWNDHMEDIGLNTLALLEAKRYLYLQGISGQIDSGAWNPPPAPAPASSVIPHSALLPRQPATRAPGQGSPSAPLQDIASGDAISALSRSVRIPHFNHWLLWHRPGEILLGRLLASTDGKGRSRYPFITLAHIINLPLAPALETCAPLIDEAARAARAAATPDATRGIITQTRARLAAAANTAPDNGSPLLPSVRLEIDTAGWTRLFHAVENQLHQYGPGAKTEYPSPRHLRLPSASTAPAQNLLWWTLCWLTQLSPKYPALLIVSEDSPASIDFIAGEPTSQQFRCLLADQTAIPIVTDIPYASGNHIASVTSELLAGADPNYIPARSLFNARTPTRDTAFAAVSSRAGLAAAIRSPGILQKLFG